MSRAGRARDRGRVLDGGPARGPEPAPEEPAMLTRRFWTLTAERSVKTFAQSLAAVLGAGGAGLLTADWKGALSAAGLAAVISVLTSIGSANIGPQDSPSVVAGPAPAPVPLQVVRSELANDGGGEAPAAA